MPDDVQEEEVQPEPESQETESAPENQAAGEEGEGEKSAGGKTVPLKTFIETRRNAQEMRAALDWYRQHVGDPKDVQKYIEWKERKSQGETGEPAPLDAERRKAVRDLMRQADPETFEAIEAFKAERAQREESMLEYAEEVMPELAREFGLSSKPSFINRLGAHVALEIREDPKLLRRWKAGDGTVVRMALERYMKDYLGEVRPKTGNGDLTVKRAISKLPTPPSGGSSTSAGAKPRKEGDRGLTKAADEEAFALLQAHLRAE